MSSGRSNATDAMSRSSFLTYFRTPTQSKRRTSSYRQRAPPPYSKRCLQSPLLPRIPEDATVEEEDNVDIESQMGFFEHYDPNDDDDCTCCEDDESDERERKCSDLFGLFGYTVLVLLIVLNLDLLLSTYNANSGLVNWNSWASGGEPAGYEMHFCLAEENRQAPTSRVWRYMPADSRENCTTGILSVYAAASKEWKALSEDAVVVGDAAEIRRSLEEDTSNDKTLSEQEEVVGDDLAEEGSLGRAKYTV